MNNSSEHSAPLQVRHIAHLARLALSDSEVQAFEEQLNKILKHVEQLKSVDVTSITATAHASPLYNVFRSDDPRPSLDREVLLQNAPHAANGLVMINKVVG